MIGFEDGPTTPARSASVEIFSRDVGPATAAVGMGIHPLHDPRLVDDFERVQLAFDADASRTTTPWSGRPSGIDFDVDGRIVKTSHQSPDYPMQLMLGSLLVPTLSRRVTDRDPLHRRPRPRASRHRTASRVTWPT